MTMRMILGVWVALVAVAFGQMIPPSGGGAGTVTDVAITGGTSTTNGTRVTLTAPTSGETTNWPYVECRWIGNSYTQVVSASTQTKINWTNEIADTAGMWNSAVATGIVPVAFAGCDWFVAVTPYVQIDDVQPNRLSILTNGVVSQSAQFTEDVTSAYSLPLVLILHDLPAGTEISSTFWSPTQRNLVDTGTSPLIKPKIIIRCLGRSR